MLQQSTVPKRITRIAIVLLITVAMLPSTLAGWWTIHQADDSYCALDNDRMDRAVASRTVHRPTTGRPDSDFSLATTGNLIPGGEGTDPIPEGTAVYVTSLGAHDRETSVKIIETNGVCLLDTSDGETPLQPSLYQYVQTEPPPLDGTGLVYHLDDAGTPTWNANPSVDSETPFPPEAWNAPFAISHREPLAATETRIWPLFQAMYAVGGALALIAMMVIARAQWQE